MSIPINITKDHIDRVISEINIDDIPKGRLSNAYFLIAGEKRLPPKFVLSEANKYANNAILSSDSFHAVEAIAFLKKLNYEIEESNSMVNIKLYDIHGASTIENYRTLITPDDKYFYWDSKRFTRNDIGDIVFWVNRTERVVLYTIIDSKEVQPSFSNGTNSITDQGYTVSATAQDASKFEIFYRFRIIEKAKMPEGWNYSNLVPFNGQTMAIILYEPKVNDPEKKIEKINDLISIFKGNEEVAEILNKALVLLKGNNLPVKKQRLLNSRNLESKDMNILTAIKTKPFILLAGISGTGKSRLVRTLAYKTCNKEELRRDAQKPGNFELIPVRPNWHDSSELKAIPAQIIEL